MWDSYIDLIVVNPALSGVSETLQNAQSRTSAQDRSHFAIQMLKLSDTTLRQLRQQARETGRSVAALVRERVEAPPDHAGESVFALTADLAGSLVGTRRSASNTRRRFRRS